MHSQFITIPAGYKFVMFCPVTHLHHTNQIPSLNIYFICINLKQNVIPKLEGHDNLYCGNENCENRY